MRPGEDDRAAAGHHGQRRDDCPALRVRLVDGRADRRLYGKPQQAADRRYQTNFGLAPMLLGHQEHVEIRPEGATDVSEQEVDGVE
jgi:hypothetical protein